MESGGFALESVPMDMIEGDTVRFTYEEAPEEMYGCRYQATSAKRIAS
jgi:hypothetical protein